MVSFSDDIWEAARALRNAVLWQSNASIEIIASALMEQRKAAEAEIARLKALPLKDEVERVLEPFAKASTENDGTERKEWRYHEDNELLETSEALTDLTAGDFRAARALLSRLRAGAQEGWRQEQLDRFGEALCAEDIGDPLRASAPRLEALAKHVLDYVFRPLPAAPSEHGGERE